MLKNLNKRKKKKGFTLIELVIVLAVLAIIALIAIPNFNKVRTDSQKKADDATCDVIKRVTQMAVADGYFKVTTTPAGTGYGKILIKMDGTTATAKIDAFGGSFTAAATGESEGGIDKYFTSLSEVEKPQEKNKKNYAIILNEKDEVLSVETTNVLTAQAIPNP